MSRASSAQGSGPFAPWLSESITRTVPPSVLNVVSSTLVRGTYRRVTSYGTVGSRVKQPPPSGSSTAANTGGESIAGAAHQSMAPSRATSATDSPSPITP